MNIIAKPTLSAAVFLVVACTTPAAFAEEARLTEADVKAMMTEACTNKDTLTKFLDFVEKARGKSERGIAAFELDEECALKLQASPETAINETADSAPGASHTDWTTDAHFSPDGKTILSASKDGTVRLWDFATGKPISKIALPPVAIRPGEPEQSPWIQSAVFVGDGKYISVAANNAPVRTYETATGKLVSEIPNKKKYGLAPTLAASGNGLLFVAQEVEQTAAGDPVTNTVKYQVPAARTVAVSDAAGLVAEAGGGRDAPVTVDLNKLENGTPVAEFQRKDGEQPDNMAFSKDGSKLAVTFGRDVVVFDTATRKELQSVQVHPIYMAFDAAFTADGKGLITCRSHPVLWDIATGKIVRRFGPFRDLCHSIDVSPDGKYMVTTSMGTDVRVWEIDTGKFYRRLGSNTNPKP